MERTTNKGSYLRPRTTATLSRGGVGRRVGYLLPTLFSRRISDPFAIVNPGHSSSSARAELFHSSCQLRELEANVEPVKLRGSSAAQGEGCTRERVLVCRLRDCDATPRTRSQSHSRARARARSRSRSRSRSYSRTRPHLTGGEGLNSLPGLSSRSPAQRATYPRLYAYSQPFL